MFVTGSHKVRGSIPLISTNPISCITRSCNSSIYGTFFFILSTVLAPQALDKVSILHNFSNKHGLIRSQVINLHVLCTISRMHLHFDLGSRMLQFKKKEPLRLPFIGKDCRLFYSDVYISVTGS